MKKLLIIIGIALLFSCEKEEVKIQEQPQQMEIIFPFPCYECEWGYIEIAHGKFQGQKADRMMRKEVTDLFKFAGGEIVVPIEGNPDWVTFYYAKQAGWIGIEVEIKNIITRVDSEDLRSWYNKVSKIENPGRVAY